jgi:hypothetical protein
MGIPLQSMLLTLFTSEAVEMPEHINILMLYEFYVKKKRDIYLSEKKLSDHTNMNVLTNDHALYDIFIDIHKAAALIAILSTHHLEKLYDKDLLKKRYIFSAENRPRPGENRYNNWRNGRTTSFSTPLEFGFGVVRILVDSTLAPKCPLHQAVFNSSKRYVARLLGKKGAITQEDRSRTPHMQSAVAAQNSSASF